MNIFILDLVLSCGIKCFSVKFVYKSGPCGNSVIKNFDNVFKTSQE